MAMQVDSTMRDEMHRAAEDLHALRAEQIVRNGEVTALVGEREWFANALRDLATALTMEQYARLRPDTLAAIDLASKPHPASTFK